MIKWMLCATAALPVAAAAQQAPAPVAPPTTPAPVVPSGAPAGAPSQAAPTSPAAQQSTRPTARSATDDAVSDEPDIIVTGQRNLPGSVVGDITPEEQLGPADIRSYGVSSVSDLLDELAPLTRSGRGSGGQPVVLLNGRRISSFAEIRDLPTEAIARVDILPEEVALKYGYRADQRVVNFVLRQRFRATTAEVADRRTTRGDRNAPQGDLDLLNIRRDQRFNLHARYQEGAPLLEDARSITSTASPFAVGGNVVGVGGGTIDPALGSATIVGVPLGSGGSPTLASFQGSGANVTDPGAYRTLLGQNRTFAANTSYARSVFGTVAATVNGSIQATNTRSDLGLPTVALTLPAGNPFSPFAGAVVVDRALSDGFRPLQQRNNTITGHLGTSLNGDVGHWRWSVTGNYDRVHAETTTDTGVDASAFQARLNARDPSANPFGPLTPAEIGAAAANRGNSTSSTGGVDALANGTLFSLPAGQVATSIRVGAETSDFSSRSFRNGTTAQGQVSRDTVNGQLNVDVPITSRTRDFGAAIGNFSLNGNVAVDQLSDFGTLTTVGYGANWSPIEAVRLLASVTDQDDAPSAQQLGNPVIATPNTRVFDYVQGTTATVTTITGGNPLLRADDRHTTKIGATIRPSKTFDLSFTANYVRSHTDDAIASFPAATAQIAAAFPDRFTRDAAGVLTRIDSRPVNLARTERSELRYGFDLSLPLKSKLQKQIELFRAGKGPNPFAGLRFPGAGRGGPFGQDGRSRQGGQGGQPGQGDRPAAAPGGGNVPTGEAAAPPGAEQASPAPGTTTGEAPAAPQGEGRGFGGNGGGPGGGFGGGRGGPGGGFGGGGFGGGGGRGRQQGGGRLQFALYHTWHFTDSVLIAANGPRLDLLNGDAIGSGGGQSRHELEGQAGYSNNGLGARLSLNYRSGTRVNGGTVAVPEPLRFSSLGTANLRLFADPTQRLDLLRKHPWLRGVRVTVAVDNLFDARQRVTDSTGSTPLSYQPDYLDPLGRTVRVSLRKLFF